MTFKPVILLSILPVMIAAQAGAADITIACGYQESEMRLCQEAADAWSAESGNHVEVIRAPERSDERYLYILDLLARDDASVDIFQIDVIWPSAMAGDLVDLTEHVPAEERAAFIRTIVDNNTVDGRLVALPWFTDAGMLYYRKDLLDKHALPVPETYGELAETALAVQTAERAGGQADLWGFVFEGQAYEGLTCNALEWISAHGGRILDDDGNIVVDSPASALALGGAAAWVDTIAPPKVTQFVEEDARITFQLGNAVFMRNWPYAWSLLQAEDSAVKGKIGVAPLPKGGVHGQHSAVLGGWQLAVSRFSENQEAAIDFVRYLTSRDEQKRRAIQGSFAPTIADLYQDPEVLDANPFFADLGATLQDAVARPSARTGVQYAQLSTLFWEAAHRTLTGYGTAADNLARLEDRLKLLQDRAGW
ncbi:MAG: ABC transporter substrate-binding protein [Alphaproteobacteria bacterium]